LAEIRRCIPTNIGMQKCFGGEAMNTANYLKNVLPNEAIVNIPYEKWNRKKLNLN
jgi:hypothetical protein